MSVSSTRFRTSVRRDEFIEWIKSLLLTPFVLHAHLQPAGDIDEPRARRYQRSLAIADARRRYATIWFDIEAVISDHRRHRRQRLQTPSKLQILVPTVGDFFTDLPLRDAFLLVDQYRFISARRFVSPSFNDIRHVLAVAQLLAHARSGGLKLATFDGDVTLYDHGQGIDPDSLVLPLLMELLKRNVVVCILTAAGYPDGVRYRERYHGMLAALRQSNVLTDVQKRNFCIMGAECNYLFRYCGGPSEIERIPESEWHLPEMRKWTEDECTRMLDVAQQVMEECIVLMKLPAEIIRKQRSVGMVPTVERLSRETLEEVVMACQRQLASQSFDVPWCAFNDCDVWADVGDKAIGARCLQNYLGGIPPEATIHVGDQFSAAAGNDFRTRTVGTTLWVTGPSETVEWLRLFSDMDENTGKKL
ncbi:IMP 5'-nucleotidase [Savitreella phatthalungensis]